MTYATPHPPRSRLDRPRSGDRSRALFPGPPCSGAGGRVPDRDDEILALIAIIQAGERLRADVCAADLRTGTTTIAGLIAGHLEIYSMMVAIGEVDGAQVEAMHVAWLAGAGAAVAMMRGRTLHTGAGIVGEG